ncbi:MAG: S49 family peptidase [Methylotenera sp.]|uniref:S49 family peptidase n=1 Tax=Methylotenera sp. TaxID=2051956 RepID=UPI00271C6436|nr:S49 family peptidase [Methylotenera sp.]MDO9204453.1 S49 family peptidase [Methylotenera sp.]MDO9393144.1 S49 family peptidase [Methylotenera sp.]MDP1521942.1 S49 family peptidase [Methylotenera sp.]MDP2231664.1 S49 family peptidase [Methylotenera sp.]MDP3141533.1 S49 family peptidase [Methylotenera sp.]
MSEDTQQSPIPSTQSQDTKWQRDAIEKLASSALTEQKTSRRWSVFFKGLTFAYLFIILFFALGWLGGGAKNIGAHTALIEVSGVIQAGGDVNADSFMESLHDAYKDKGTKGIILRINSPGGSPVQAGIINDEIKRQKKLHPKIPVYAVVEDICASGGYYIAVAADKIYVDKASIVGSIGVLMDGYGFTEVMKKVGVERRLMTAGENKAMLDPFSPVNPKHQALAQTMLNEIHEQFKTVVRQGRTTRLKETPETFSGLFWSGEQSIKMGLADAIGSADYVAREVIKQEKIVDFTTQEDFASRLAKRIGASASASFGEMLAKQIVKAGEVKLH